MTIDAMKQALEALIQARKLRFALWRHGCDCRDEHTCDPLQDEYAKQFNDSIIKLEQAIKELENQEPYGYYDEADDMFTKTGFYSNESELIAEGRILALYLHPPQRKPLTDDQIYEMYNEPRSDAEMLEFARAIEAAHGIKE